jgi:hypothetical protein
MGVIGNQSGGLARAFYLVPACYLILALLIGYDRFSLRTSRTYKSTGVAHDTYRE